MSIIESRYDDAVPDGTATDGRKGIAYLRDYFVPATAAALDELVATADAR